MITCPEGDSICYLKKDMSPLNGVWVTYHENGQLADKTSCKDGVFHGSSKSWYENGQLKSEGYYKDDKKTRHY
jgi:antitoxin component YwqK of YwqJK toxin-antitoxin module